MRYKFQKTLNVLQDFQAVNSDHVFNTGYFSMHQLFSTLIFQKNAALPMLTHMFC